MSQTKPELIETIAFRCKHCGKKLLKAQKLSGIQITCHECAGEIIVPEKSDRSIDPEKTVAETTRTDLLAAKTKSAPEDRILFWCSYCGQKYRLPQHLAGKAGSCDSCQNDFVIPGVSQTKPELKKTVGFPCGHCGRKILQAQELAGTEIACYECGENNIVPEKSKKTLIQRITPASLAEPFIAVETTRTDMPAAVPAAKTEPAAKDKILFWCGHCGQKYRLPRQLTGKAGICAKCQNYLFIPQVSQTKPELENTLVFPCKYCGTKIRKARKLAGTEVKCGKCARKVTVPEKSRISALAKAGSTPEDRILFWCDSCGQKYRLPQHLAGKSGTCDKCENDFVIPQVSQIKPKLKKMVVFPCEHCGKKLWKAQELAGTKIECSQCGGKIIVPAESEISALEQTGLSLGNKILFWCSCCGQKYRLPRQLAGKSATCDKCCNDLLIPAVSQTEPILVETIVFPCVHCKAKLRKVKKFAGREIVCHECGGKVLVPRKSQKSLIQRVSPVKLLEAFIVAEKTRTDLVTVGRKPVQVPVELKVSGGAKASDKAEVTKETQSSIHSSARASSFHRMPPSPEPRIIITEDPPTIHKIKNYFQKKAEKYFIFAVLVVFTDYLIDTYGESHRSPKPFILLSTFAIAAIILLATWNYVTLKPPNETSKCRYNIACIKCKKSEIRRFEDITRQTCSTCSQPVGLVYHCKKCKKYFVYDEAKSRRELKAKNRRDAKRKARKNGTELKVENTIFSNSILIKCPFCRSENVAYVTVREAERLTKKYGKKKK